MLKLKGDYAQGLRTLPAELEGSDYARGLRTMHPQPEGADYARGLRTLPYEPEGPDYARGMRTHAGDTLPGPRARVSKTGVATAGK